MGPQIEDEVVALTIAQRLEDPDAKPDRDGRDLCLCDGAFLICRKLADDPRLDPPVGGVGVREPRRPVHPSASGAIALEPPPTETRDVWAVGDED